jgi:hypothetical protein
VVDRSIEEARGIIDSLSINAVKRGLAKTSAVVVIKLARKQR